MTFLFLVTNGNNTNGLKEKGSVYMECVGNIDLCLHVLLGFIKQPHKLNKKKKFILL